MKLIEIYDGTLFQAQMLKNLLENAGIEALLKDEIIGTRGGGAWRPAGGVKVIVDDMDYDRAILIVDEFDKSQSTN